MRKEVEQFERHPSYVQKLRELKRENFEIHCMGYNGSRNNYSSQYCSPTLVSQSLQVYSLYCGDIFKFVEIVPMQSQKLKMHETQKKQDACLGMEYDIYITV